MYPLTCLFVFLAAYLVNTTTISVLYHRGLAHGAVELSPAVRRFTARAGIWLTGLDPKGWVCMHRRHHAYSDTTSDPHSPVHLGLLGVLLGQLRSYERTLVGLVRGNATYAAYVEDLEFPVSWLNRRGLWYLPYAVHLVLALGVAVPTGHWLLGGAYLFGIMSHPLEGWVVNAFGHAVGGRNFATPDNARNNHVAAWLIVGEGYQNNHHRFPASARFSYRWPEVDLGYGICRVLDALGALRIRRDTLLPAPSARTGAHGDAAPLAAGAATS
jgi:stearoyl-CoA desaturase (delta-9 desaturase)